MRQHLGYLHKKITSRSRRAIGFRIGLYISVGLFIFLGIHNYAQTAQSKSLAQVPTPSPAENKKTSEISSNSVLVRVKKSAKNKIDKKNPLESNLVSLKELKKKYKIKKFEQIAKPNARSNQNEDIFSWYKIELDEKQEKIEAKYNAKTKKLSSSHVKTKNLQNVIDTLRTDTDIEIIEPEVFVELPQTDTTPPPVPQNLRGEALSSYSIRLSWDAVTTEYIGTYNIYMNGNLRIQGNILTYTFTNLLPSTTYTFNIQAQDSAGNRSLISDPITVTTFALGTGSTSSSPTPTVIQDQSIPNDPYYSTGSSWGYTFEDMWGMKRVNMEQAWAENTGTKNVVIGLIDSGLDKGHEDIQNNVWVNTREVAGNGIDDDGNGYIDDINGWDFTNNTNNPVDYYGHGTAVAGVMGAVGNNTKGIVGTAWNTSIMDLRVYGSNAESSFSWIMQAIQYATDNGADIIHNSYQATYSGSYTILEDTLKYAYQNDVVLIAPAGNFNVDARDNIPSQSPYTIVIAAMDQFDQRSVWSGGQASNYGEKLDITAPGSNVLTSKSRYSSRYASVPTNSYYSILGGTSVSSPFATGLVAVLLSEYPNLSNEEIRQILRKSAADIGTPGKDNYHGYGRMDGSAAMYQASQQHLTPFITSPIRYTTVSGNVPVMGTVNGANFSSYKIEIGPGRSPTTWYLITNSTSSVTNNTLGIIDTNKYTPGSYTIKVTAYNTSGIAYEYQMFDVTLANTPSLTPTLTNTPSPSIPSVTPTLTSTPTPTNTPTPSPTFTPTPTRTPTPTSTPTNTPTPTPTPIPIPGMTCNPSANGITWSWNEVPNTTYWLQVSSADGSDWRFNSWVASTWQYTSGAQGVTYRGRVLAGDGNTQSAFSNYVYCTVPAPTSTPTPTRTPTPAPDIQGPNVNITNPQHNGSVSRKSTTSITANVSDPSGVARAEFLVDGKRACNDSSAPYSCNWKVPARGNVSYTITVRGYDTKNNMTSTSINVFAR